MTDALKSTTALTSVEQNGFEMHGIQHSSVSSQNLWQSNPAMWITQYLLKVKRPPSAAMIRGIVSEDAVSAVLCGGSVSDALKAALKKFDDQVFIANDTTEKERAAIEPIIELALEQLKEYGEPDFEITGGQKKVSITCSGDGWKLPVIGYLDFVFPKHGLVVDLKTTMRLPSKQSADHVRQRCFYQRCVGNIAVKFLYVTPKKTNWLEDGDVNEQLELIKATLNRQERFLRVSKDPEFLASIIPVDPSHFYWSDCIEQRKKIFGI